MRKIIAMLLLCVSAMTGHAQSQSKDIVFNAGKFYANAQLSGLEGGYTSFDKLKLTLGGKVGYMIVDDFMLLAQAQYKTGHNDFDELRLGGGVRYYIEQNGLYLGAMANFAYKEDIFRDFRPEVNIGYSYFISRTVTIEPELYYEQSFVNHSKYSGFGLRIGFGIYLDKLPDFR